jgi:hypothetical protein
MFYDGLTSLIAGLVLSSIAGMKTIASHSEVIFEKSQNSSEKHACEKLEGTKFFIAHVMTFVATLPSFRKPITP